MDEPRPTRPLRRWLLQFSAVLLIGAALVGGLAWLVHAARDTIWASPRYQVAFADIDCNPQSPLTRSEFLDEVQYLAEMPDRFSLVEDGLEEKLRVAFTKHPWVRSVRVTLKAPHTVSLAITYRQPVLAVAVAEQPLRAVDQDGVLLPQKALIPPTLLTLEKAPRPKGAAGQPWGDPVVELAAKTAHLIAAQDAPPLTRLEWSADGLVLWGRDFKALWGRSPADAARLDRLRDAVDKLERLPRWSPWMHEVDLREREVVVRTVVRESR